MGRLAWSQLRFRTSRAIALLIGLLLATTAFTVLTAASRTAQLRTAGTVSAHFATAYDILVRPRGSRTALETRTGTVQPNFLSGIFGGITLRQWHQIEQTPGVSVAAPIAVVGYTEFEAVIPVTVPAAEYHRPGRQLYRIVTTWVSQGGSTRITPPPSYLYVTPDRIQYRLQRNNPLVEELPGGGVATVCPLRGVPPTANPFGQAAQSNVECWSKADGFGAGLPGVSRASGVRISRAQYYVYWEVPLLVAAIDPAAEAKLDGLNQALVSGRYLAEKAGARTGAAGRTEFPVLAASSSGMDEYALTELQQLADPVAAPKMSGAWMTREATAPAKTVATARITTAQAYRHVYDSFITGQGRVRGVSPLWGYWTAGPVSYRHAGSGVLVPQQVRNPASVWYTGGVHAPPMDSADVQFRALAVHTTHFDLTAPHPVAPGEHQAFARVVGTFAATRIRSFDRLAQLPLGYQPVTATPATAASRNALHGQNLLPNQNLGGYVSQPVDLITTLSALPALESAYYGDSAHAADPISAIRVRVAGVTGPNPVSLERIREVAQQIAVRTHLDVDIVAGSSPSPTSIALPAGRFGRPALRLSEGWVKKGVAVAILTAIDKNSVVLFTLILIVCVLFVANSASAAIRGRRRELGVLACLGWTRPRLFTVVLGEVAAVGLAAGLLGAAAALPLSSALGLHASPGRAALAAPIAVGVAVVAGVVPAWLAATAEPVASIRPAVLGVRRARQPGGITALAAVNVLRTPGRALVAAISLAVGVTALTVLAALTFAFRGVVVGSLLGNAVAVQVRGVDYVAVVATVALGVLAVADVVFLNIRERAAELAAIRAFGWRESALSRLVVTEGGIIGLAGSAAGAALGLAAAASFAGQLPAALYLVAAAAVVAGVLVTAAAALLPARALRHLPAAHLLAED